MLQQPSVRRDQLIVRLIIDSHVHLYPCYNLALALRNLNFNLSKLAPDAVRIGLLAERHDCNFFTDLASGERILHDEGMRVSSSDEEGAVLLHIDDGDPLYLLSGRQIVTRERIEVLGVAMTGYVDDRMSAIDTVSAVLSNGGVPILSWAPGKWFFKRGEIVKSILHEFGHGRILVGDTTLRPWVWPEPLLIRRAIRAGIGVVAGSDPLPFTGEETLAGSYASAGEGDFSPGTPVTDVRNFLLATARRGRIGHRSGILEMLSRLRRNSASRAQTDH